MASGQESSTPTESLESNGQESSTLTEFLDTQRTLIQEASEALPHQFSHCSYLLGPFSLRQAVYLCLTCPEARGLCSACSVTCHTDHEQIELFPKRNFRCDCPTSAIAHPCGLHQKMEPENKSNRYGQNFKGTFCRCKRPYDGTKERETMIQCLACEDWFHESCCNLRERPPSRAPSPEPDEENDGASEASSSGLPPALISASDYDTFICAACVVSIPILKRIAGTPGAIMVIRGGPSDPWRLLHEAASTTFDVDLPVAESRVQSAKRSRSSSLHDVPEPKRSRTSSSAAEHSIPEFTSCCLAPPLNAIAQAALAHQTLSPGDLFLTDGFRERWCRCSSCLPMLEPYPFLLEEEETYEPPEDPDSGLSLEELGIRALARLPRDRAIDSIHAYNALRDDLKKYLMPFAQEGKVVNESDIQSFFDKLNENKKGDGLR
ncbi:hypothetical protein C8J56DRAFT_923840 [Mycena floridula]|nr:hypothetical protein C8J56DRAFT_923840 [Mycena floridula]